jgi:hypothetical protein
MVHERYLRLGYLLNCPLFLQVHLSNWYNHTEQVATVRMGFMRRLASNLRLIFLD